MKKHEDVLLGQKIKEIRSNLKMDQKTFARKINATVSALSNWENGRNKPNDIMLREIAKLGNTSIEELLSPSLEEAIKKYIDEIMAFEIKQGDQKYKILYEPSEKIELIEYLLQQDWDGLTINYGVRYETKTRLEEYLDKKILLQKYTPYSDKNATWYASDEVNNFRKRINEYFRKENIDLINISYLKNNQIKKELSADLYHEIITKLDELSIFLQNYEV